MVPRYVANQTENMSSYQDRYADEYSVPVLDKQQDYELTGFSEEDGTTTLKFKRKIDTCDQRDRKILVGCFKFGYLISSLCPLSSVYLSTVQLY